MYRTRIETTLELLIVQLQMEIPILFYNLATVQLQIRLLSNQQTFIPRVASGKSHCLVLATGIASSMAMLIY